MSKQLFITGITTANTTATENTLVDIDPVRAILSGYMMVEDILSGIVVATALTVVTDTPDANLEIQLTAVNKFKLYLTTGLIDKDSLILNVAMKGEVVRP